MISFRHLTIFLACFSLIQAYFLTKNSCENQCTNNYYPDNSCQCNPECESHGNCCSDYESECKTCENRCGQGLNNNYPCQCNQQCKDYKDCCPNYDAICNGGGEGKLNRFWQFSIKYSVNVGQKISESGLYTWDLSC